MTRNPSAWSRRLPLLALALLGLCIAAYLAAYQIGLVTTLWDPVFGTGARAVLHSVVSRLLPVPDAALGALGYLTEAAADLLGGHERWRAQPWAVALFGAVAAGLAVVSILLVGLQAFVFHAGCSLCLTSAAISITVGVLALDEVLATARYLRAQAREGRGALWRAFWGLEEGGHATHGGEHAI